MRRTVLTIFALSLFMLIPVDALAQTTQGPTKIKGTATNGIGLEVTGPTQLDGALTGTSASFSGTVAAATTNGIANAAMYPGADCGAKIMATDAAFSSIPVEIDVNQSCGMAWTTAVTLSHNHTLRFVQGGVYTTSASVTLAGNGASIVGQPSPSEIGDLLHGSAYLQAANGANLAAVLVLGSASGAENVVDNLVVDGNKVNGGTSASGVAIEVDRSGRFELRHVTTQNATSHGIWIHSTGTNNESCCGKITNSFSIDNGGSGLYGERTGDTFISGTEFESNGRYGIEAVGFAVVRLDHSDIGGNAMGGVNVIPALSPLFTSQGWLVSNTQFGGNGGNDFNCDGSLMAWSVGFHTITGNQFTINNMLKTDNTYDAIHLQDCNASVTGNVFLGGGGYRYRYMVNEPAQVNVLPMGSSVVGNLINVGSYGTGVLNLLPQSTYFGNNDQADSYWQFGFNNSLIPNVTNAYNLCDPSFTCRDLYLSDYFSMSNGLASINAQGRGTFTGAQVMVNGGGSSAATLDMFDTTAAAVTPHKFFRISAGVLQILNSGFTAPIASLDDAGNFSAAGSETLGSPLLPASGGTGATTAAGANLNITGVTQTGTLGTSSQVSTFPGTGTFSTVAAKTSVSFGATNTSADTTTIRNAVAASPTTQPSVNPFYLPPQTPLYLFDSTLSDGQIAAITTPLPINGQNGLLQFNVASGMDGFLIKPGTYSSGLGGDGYYYQNVTNQNQTFVEASAPNTWLPGGANVRYWLRFDASNQGGFMNRWINNRFFGTTSGYSFFMNNATSGGVAPNQSAQNSNGGLFVSTIADNFMSAGIYMRNAGDTNLIRHNHINAPHGIYYSEISGAVDTLFEHNSVTSGDCPILYAGGYGASFIYNELGISQYFSQGCTTGTLTVGDGTSAVGNALVMGNTLGVDQVPTVPVSPLYIGATSTNVSVEWNMFEPPASTGNALIYNAGTLTRPGRNNWISGSKSPVVSQIVGPGTTAWENNKSIEGAAPVGVLENRLTCSEDLTCLSWVPANLGAGSLPAPTNVSGVATPNDPQNTSTVSCLVLALNGGTTTGDSSSITQSLTGLTNPHPVVGSAWLKSNVQVTGASVSGSGTGATITYTLSEIASCGGLTTAGAVSGKPYTVANVNPSSCNATAATVTATGTNTVTVAAPNTTCSYVSGGNVVFKIDVADGANGEEYDIGWANPNYPDNGWIRPSVSTPPSTAATTDLLRFVIVGSTVSTYSDSVDLLFGGADNASGLYPHIETTSTGPQPLQYGVMANGVKGAIPWAPSSTTPQNQLLYSGDLTNGAWVPSHSGLGSNPVVTTSAVLDPNGYATQQVAFNLNGDLTNTAYSELIQTVSGATNPHMAYERVCIKPTAATAIGGGSITNPVVFLGVVGYGNAQVTLTVGSWSCFNFTTSVAATSTQWVLFTAKPAAFGTDTMTALVSESQLSYKSIGISSYAQTTTAAIDYTSATAIYALNGDVTAQGNASTPVLATVKAINGAAVPTSKTVVGTNSNGQLVDASGATLTNNTSGTAASLLGTGGMWKPVAKVASSLYSGTTSTGLTTIYTPGSAGEFLLCGDMRITVAPSAQTQAEVYRSYTTDGHTDAGAVNTGANGQVVANLGTTTTQWAGAKACEPFWSDAAAIQVELFLSGVTGTPTYRWSATLYQMQ